MRDRRLGEPAEASHELATDARPMAGVGSSEPRRGAFEKPRRAIGRLKHLVCHERQVSTAPCTSPDLAGGRLPSAVRSGLWLRWLWRVGTRSGVSVNPRETRQRSGAPAQPVGVGCTALSAAKTGRGGMGGDGAGRWRDGGSLAWVMEARWRGVGGLFLALAGRWRSCWRVMLLPMAARWRCWRGRSRRAFSRRDARGGV